MHPNVCVCLCVLVYEYYSAMLLLLLLLLLSRFSCVQLCVTTRLRRPWDTLGKNTGVGCHFLRQCIKVKSESEVAQSCPTPRDPMDCSPPGSYVHGISQARVLECVAIAFSDHIGNDIIPYPTNYISCGISTAMTLFPLF